MANTNTKLTGLNTESTANSAVLDIETINSCSIMMQKALCAIALSYGITDKVITKTYERKDGTTGVNLTLTNAECIELLTELKVI